VSYLAVLVQYRRVTDGLTDTRTYGRRHDDRIYRVSIASGGKHVSMLVACWAICYLV